MCFNSRSDFLPLIIAVVSISIPGSVVRRLVILMLWNVVEQLKQTVWCGVACEVTLYMLKLMCYVVSCFNYSQ